MVLVLLEFHSWVCKKSKFKSLRQLNLLLIAEVQRRREVPGGTWDSIACRPGSQLFSLQPITQKYHFAVD